MEMNKTAMNDDMLDQVTGGSCLNYRVKPGDTLASIAKRYKVTVEQLMRWNNIKDPNLIVVNQEIRILF